MKPTIALAVHHPVIAPGPIEGFRFLWAFYVHGFKSDRHCQPCFKGKRVAEFCTVTARSGRTVRLSEIGRFPYAYVCGVAAGPDRLRGERNLHLPLRYRAGGLVTKITWNGYIVTARDAEEVPIPPLPDDWHGLPRRTVRCKNFQFGVAYFLEGREATDASAHPMDIARDASPV